MVMADRNLNTQFEPLEPRALLSHAGPGASPDGASKGRAMSPALVGSIQGTETISAQGYQIGGTGAMTPLGNVIATGFFGGGKGALNDKGTVTFSNSQGSLTLSLKTHGYFPLRSQDAEEIRVTVQVRSTTGSYTGIHVAGTINLVNGIVGFRGGYRPPVPFTADVSLKPTK
jgi:hypothetical protein